MTQPAPGLFRSLQNPHRPKALFWPTVFTCFSFVPRKLPSGRESHVGICPLPCHYVSHTWESALCHAEVASLDNTSVDGHVSPAISFPRALRSGWWGHGLFHCWVTAENQSWNLALWALPCKPHRVWKRSSSWGTPLSSHLEGKWPQAQSPGG